MEFNDLTDFFFQRVGGYKQDKVHSYLEIEINKIQCFKVAQDEHLSFVSF